MSAVLMTLGQVRQWLDATGDACRPLLCSGDMGTPVLRVHTDTRSISPGDLFVALQGDTFDANTLLHQAQAQGAAAVLCRSGLALELVPANLPRIEVPDTLVALGQLAHAWRAQFDLPLIAVAGSNGKTTVTQMIASILQAHASDDSLATQGNLNNAIGVPLTLLRLRAHHRIAVVELGMNHPGEIATLAALVQPTVALVNNAQREHLEFMQTVDAVATENGAVISALPPSGCAVFPQDDSYTAQWQGSAGTRRTLGFSAHAVGGDAVVGHSAQWTDGAWSVQAEATVGGRSTLLHYRLAIAGQHNVRNSWAAAACALAAGVSAQAVERGLQAFVPVKGRSRAFALKLGARSITVVDDTYNANPDSVRAATELLRDLPAPRLLVLGDMGEVGVQGPKFHTEAGTYAHQLGIERLLAVGALSQSAVEAFTAAGGSAQHFDNMDALCAALAPALEKAASVLVKGSRFMRMERAVAALQQGATPPNTAPTQGAAACC